MFSRMVCNRNLSSLLPRAQLLPSLLPSFSAESLPSRSRSFTPWMPHFVVNSFESK